MSRNAGTRWIGSLAVSLILALILVGHAGSTSVSADRDDLDVADVQDVEEPAVLGPALQSGGIQVWIRDSSDPADHGHVPNGEQLTYSITVKNTTRFSLSNFDVFGEYPASALSFVQALGDGVDDGIVFDCQFDAREASYSCQMDGRLAPGQSTTFMISGTVHARAGDSLYLSADVQGYRGGGALGATGSGEHEVKVCNCTCSLSLPPETTFEKVLSWLRPATGPGRDGDVHLSGG